MHLTTQMLEGLRKFDTPQVTAFPENGKDVAKADHGTAGFKGEDRFEAGIGGNYGRTDGLEGVTALLWVVKTEERSIV